MPDRRFQYKSTVLPSQGTDHVDRALGRAFVMTGEQRSQRPKEQAGLLPLFIDGSLLSARLGSCIHKLLPDSQRVVQFIRKYFPLFWIFHAFALRMGDWNSINMRFFVDSEWEVGNEL